MLHNFLTKYLQRCSTTYVTFTIGTAEHNTASHGCITILKVSSCIIEKYLNLVFCSAYVKKLILSIEYFEMLAKKRNKNV